MNLREQTYVLAIAKYGSIKPAAEELHISPPTLSVFLTNLERELGIRLFDRLGKRFIPTDAGRLYISTSQAMVDLQKNYETELNDLKNGVSGTIHFGIHPRRTLHLLPAALREFTPLYPNVQIITCEEVADITVPLLLKGELDFIIHNRVVNDPNLIHMPFYQDHLVLVMAADHPLADCGITIPGQKIQWIDLSLFQEERFILQQPDQSSRKYADRALRHMNIAPKHTFQVANLETSSQIAAEGLGIAFNFERYIENFSYKKPIRYFYVGDLKDTIDYYILYRKDKYLSSTTLAFIDALKRNIS